MAKVERECLGNVSGTLSLRDLRPGFARVAAAAWWFLALVAAWKLYSALVTVGLQLCEDFITVNGVAGKGAKGPSPRIMVQADVPRSKKAFLRDDNRILRLRGLTHFFEQAGQKG